SASHAAHASAAPVTVDDAWQHLHAALHPAEHADGADAARHGTAAHMKDMAKRPNWVVPVAIVAVALVVALGGIWYFDKLGEQPAITSALASPEAKITSSATSQIAVVTLDDGTRVTLAPESRLIVPKDFSGSAMRAVKIEGAATFEVAPGQKAAFEVRADNVGIFDTGTKFTVYAYPLDSTVTVHVQEGAVSLQLMSTKDTHPITAGKALFVSKSGAIREPSAVELAEATSWTNHRVTLANRQLRDALQMFKRWYGMDIKVPELPLLDRPVSVDANLDSSRSAISQVEETAHVKFGWEGQNMLFSDNSKPAAKAAPVRQAGRGARTSKRKK
ncbi:MAG TPA: FecR family protein, partial [Gemmatimonadaceae bacterium]